MDTTVCNVQYVKIDKKKKTQQTINVMSDHQSMPTLQVHEVKQINGRPAGGANNLEEVKKIELMDRKDYDYDSSSDCKRNLRVSAHGLAVLCWHKVSAAKKMDDLTAEDKKDKNGLYQGVQLKDEQKEKLAMGGKRSQDTKGSGKNGEDRLLTPGLEGASAHLIFELNTNMHDDPNTKTHITVGRQVDGFHRIKEGQIAHIEVKSLQCSNISKKRFFNEILYSHVVKCYATKMPIFCIIQRIYNHRKCDDDLRQVFFWEDVSLLLPETYITAIDSFITKLLKCICKKELKENSLEKVSLSADGVTPCGENFPEQDREPLKMDDQLDIPNFFERVEEENVYKNVLVSSTKHELLLNRETTEFIFKVHFKDKIFNEKMIFVAENYSVLLGLLYGFEREESRTRDDPICFHVLIKESISSDQQERVTSLINYPDNNNGVVFEHYEDQNKLQKLKKICDDVKPRYEGGRRIYNIAIVSTKTIIKRAGVWSIEVKWTSLPPAFDNMEKIIYLVDNIDQLKRLLDLREKPFPRNAETRFFVLYRAVPKNELTSEQEVEIKRRINEAGEKKYKNQVVFKRYEYQNDLKEKFETSVPPLPHTLLLLGDKVRVPIKLATDSLDFFKLPTWEHFHHMLAEPQLVAIIGTRCEHDAWIGRVKEAFPETDICWFDGASNRLEEEMKAKGFPIMESFEFVDEYWK